MMVGYYLVNLDDGEHYFAAISENNLRSFLRKSWNESDPNIIKITEEMARKSRYFITFEEPDIAKEVEVNL